MSRYCLIALLLCLAGCDKPENVAPASPVVPVAVPEVPAVAAVPIAAGPAPTSAPAEPESLPLPAPVVQAPRPNPVASKPASKSSATGQKLAPLPLDLSLPHDLVDQLEPGQRDPEHGESEQVEAAPGQVEQQRLATVPAQPRQCVEGGQ